MSTFLKCMAELIKLEQEKNELKMQLTETKPPNDEEIEEKANQYLIDGLDKESFLTGARYVIQKINK